MHNRIKIAIIGTNGLPGRYGGWDQLLNHLTYNLKDKFLFVVYTSSYNAIDGQKSFNQAELRIIPLKANGIQSIPYDIFSMIDAIFKRCDILLILGTSGCIFLPIVKLFKKEIILNPDGAEWKRGKWGSLAKWFLFQSEKFGIKFADIIISDNKIIQKYILKCYNVNSELIEYGGDNARRVDMHSETEKKYGIKSKQYAFKVCRIVPENNIDLILEAFAGRELKLILIGNWTFSQYGKEIRVKFQHYSNLLLLDPIYEQSKLDELRGNCALYIHGHSVGGTNPSLVEAMSLGLCCIVFNVDYNLETTENLALYFSSKEELEKILNDYQEKKIDTEKYSQNMLAIAKRRYLWSMITDKYANTFARAINQ
jgi:glycosyltransferase involved in cell wall biosynthesis